MDESHGSGHHEGGPQPFLKDHAVQFKKRHRRVSEYGDPSVEDGPCLSHGEEGSGEARVAGLIGHVGVGYMAADAFLRIGRAGGLQPLQGETRPDHVGIHVDRKASPQGPDGRIDDARRKADKVHDPEIARCMNHPAHYLPFLGDKAMGRGLPVNDLQGAILDFRAAAWMLQKRVDGGLRSLGSGPAVQQSLGHVRPPSQVLIKCSSSAGRLAR
ncbi:MAG: hypothetical protein A4E73_00646 [Syntrophaceae bacterium PtaU1.Bin231]|nr:MAG: hypothetical protein A4E73_00646 [Syntrophaceae bacterium PtaU1.Bin231]